MPIRMGLRLNLQAASLANARSTCHPNVGSLTIAMRTGEVSVVTPFRYTRLLFALLLGIVVFNETPDIWTLAGGSIVVFSGVYALLGSRQKRQHQVDAPS